MRDAVKNTAHFSKYDAKMDSDVNESEICGSCHDVVTRGARKPRDGAQQLAVGEELVVGPAHRLLRLEAGLALRGLLEAGEDPREAALRAGDEELLLRPEEPEEVGLRDARGAAECKLRQPALFAPPFQPQPERLYLGGH